MTAIRRAVDITRVQYQLALVEPQRMFLVSFAIFMLIGPGLATLLIAPLPLRSWVTAGAVCSFASGLLALIVGMRTMARAPLSWLACSALLMQVMICGLFVCGIFGAQLGYLHPPEDSAMRDALPNVAIAAWAFLGLGSAWGIYRDRWWGYFGENLFLVLLIVAFFFAPSPETIQPSRVDLPPAFAWIKRASYWLGFGYLNYLLFIRGRQALAAQRQSE